MTIIATYNWLPNDTAAICKSQTTAAAADLLINGTEATVVPFAQSGFVKLVGVSRTVSITTNSNVDLSSINFTITGSKGGYPVSATLAGPTIIQQTVETTAYFDTITSVHASAAVTGASIGTGLNGHTNWFAYDHYPSFPALGVQVNILGGAGGVYTFLHTLLDATNVPLMDSLGGNGYAGGIIMPHPDNANAYTLVMFNQTTSGYAAFMYPTRYCSVAIGENAGGSGFTVNFAQQGLH